MVWFSDTYYELPYIYSVNCFILIFILIRKRNYPKMYWISTTVVLRISSRWVGSFYGTNHLVKDFELKKIVFLPTSNKISNKAALPPTSRPPNVKNNVKNTEKLYIFGDFQIHDLTLSMLWVHTPISFYQMINRPTHLEIITFQKKINEKNTFSYKYLTILFYKYHMDVEF